MEEILRGLNDLVSSGKILHAALSNFPAWRVSRAATLADLKNWAPVSGIQIEYSLVERTADLELLPMAASPGLGAALWSPLGGGLLTGKFRRGPEGRLTDFKTLMHTESTEQKTAVVDSVVAVAEEAGATPAQVSVARLRERAAQAATSFVPIIGPRNLSQLDDHLGALDVQLTPEQFARLSEVSGIPLGVPTRRPPPPETTFRAVTPPSSTSLPYPRPEPRNPPSRRPLPPCIVGLGESPCGADHPGCRSAAGTLRGDVRAPWQAKVTRPIRVPRGPAPFATC
ncbi:aldo/keto reductase [Streptomyces sp. NPDC005485]|uniref:aldo/keto reductase n=1 Tax=Streptomyces sp. NPDC005485 TaxID=3155591 RepID=UPI0033B7D469